MQDYLCMEVAHVSSNPLLSRELQDWEMDGMQDFWLLCILQLLRVVVPISRFGVFKKGVFEVKSF